MRPTEKEIRIAESIIDYVDGFNFKYLLDVAKRKCKYDEYLREKGLYYEWDEVRVYLQAGATKACLICDELENWVIKFPITRNDGLNFCKIEAENYAAAKEAGLEEFFAETYYIGEYKGYSFSLQEKVRPDEDGFEDILYDYARDIVDEDYMYVINREDDEERYRSDCIREYVEEMNDEQIIEIIFSGISFEDYDKLIDFIGVHGINDLHTGNYGFRKDNTPVIIDFGGYSK